MDARAPSSRPSFRVLPSPTLYSTPFWTGGEVGELRICRCRSCGRFFHPPAPVCFRCRSTDVGPEVVSGLAHVATFTVNHHPWFEGFTPPYVIAIVEIDEEPTVRLTTNVVDCHVDDVVIGLAVEVAFEPWEDVWVPVFRPAPSAGSR